MQLDIVSRNMLQQHAEAPITKLPAELLENILLYAVDDAVDYKQTARYSPRYPWSQSQRHRLLESVRLVCHRFNDNAWRAYARVAEQTIFDLRSKASMQALTTMSSHTKLRPWIKKLRFAFHAVAKTNAEDDRRCNQEELDAIKLVDAQWFPKVWSLAGVAHPIHGGTDLLPLQTQEQIAHASHLILLIARAVGKLEHLDEVQYFLATGLPPRYMGVVTVAHVISDTYAAYHDYTAQLGLEILLRALAEAGQAPKSLDLAISTNQHHTFVCETPLSLIRQIARKVEKLRLHSPMRHGTFVNDGRRLNQIVLSKSTFPALRDLTLKNQSYMPIEFPIALPPPSDLPNLDILTTELDSDDPDVTFTFFATYGANVRKFVIENYTRPWPPLLTRLAAMDLNLLELRHNEYFPIDGDYENFIAMMRGLDEEMLRDVARKLVIRPKRYKRRVLRHLESPEQPSDDSDPDDNSDLDTTDSDSDRSTMDDEGLEDEHRDFPLVSGSDEGEDRDVADAGDGGEEVWETEEEQDKDEVQKSRPIRRQRKVDPVSPEQPEQSDVEMEGVDSDFPEQSEYSDWETEPEEEEPEVSDDESEGSVDVFYRF